MSTVRDAPTDGEASSLTARTSEEIYHLLTQFESRNRILEHQVDGWCVWPVLRYAVATELHRLSGGGGGLVHASIRKRVATACGDLLSVATLPKRPVFVKTVSSAFRNQTDGRATDVYFEDVYPHLRGYVCVAGVNNPAFQSAMRSAAHPPNSTTTYIDLLSGFLSRRRPKTTELAMAESISGAVIRDFGLPRYTPERVARAIRWFGAQRRLYRHLLNKTGAQLALTTTPEEYGLYAAARDLGLPSVELQHGLFDRFHSAYVWAHDVEPFGRQIPHSDHLLVYGEAFRDELTSIGYVPNQVRIAGNPRIDNVRTLREPRSGGPVRILLTTQGVDTIRVQAFVRDFVRLAKSGPDYRLHIKMHPGYETDKAPYLRAIDGEERAEVLLGNEEPNTQELLLKADLHVSISSTTHFEALALGVPTAVLPYETHHYAAMLTRNGHAPIINSAEQLVAMLSDCRALTVPQNVSETYFAKDAVQNIVRQLAQLVPEGVVAPS